METDLALIRAIPDAPPQAFLDALQSLRPGTKMTKLWRLIGRCEAKGGPVVLGQAPSDDSNAQDG
jgi:hypothetical protein